MKLTIDPQKVCGTVAPELHSHFVEFLGSCIYDGIWVGEDSPIPNIQGLRKDIVEGFRELQPPVIRWPGGCYADTYHWRNAIGPRQSRPVTYNENFGTYEMDPNTFGTHEFMRFCELVGAKPWLNVNMMTGSVPEMREWMEYCNRREETTLTEERSANGHPEPFGVEYWGIGNEVWAGGGTSTPQSYANAYRQYASAVPRFHGEPMRLIASGPDGNKPAERVAWTRELFRELARFRQPKMDGYDLHFYNWNLKNFQETETSFDKGAWDSVIEGCRELEQVICEQYDLLCQGLELWKQGKGEDPFYQEPKVDLVVGEWGNWHAAAFQARPALYQQCSMRDAVTTALTLDIFHRNCQKVTLACVAQSVNVLNSLFLTQGEKTLRTPNYDVFQMYMPHRGGQAVELEMEGTASVCAFASTREGMLTVNLVNTSFDVPETVDLEGNWAYLRGKLLCSENPQDVNTFEDPDHIRAKEAPVPEKTETGWKIAMPAASVQTLTFRL